MTEIIYMPLDNEGLSVRRPVPAYRREDGRYIILRPTDYDASMEEWAFPPGSTVEVERTKTASGEILTATSRVTEGSGAPARRAM